MGRGASPLAPPRPPSQPVVLFPASCQRGLHRGQVAHFPAGFESSYFLPIKPRFQWPRSCTHTTRSSHTRPPSTSEPLKRPHQSPHPSSRTPPSVAPQVRGHSVLLCSSAPTLTRVGHCRFQSRPIASVHTSIHSTHFKSSGRPLVRYL